MCYISYVTAYLDMAIYIFCTRNTLLVGMKRREGATEEAETRREGTDEEFHADQ